MESRFVTVDGIRTHVLEAGAGSPVLLLHGGAFGESAETAWAPVVPALAAHRRVIAPDLLGFGETDKVRDFADVLGRIRLHLARLVEELVEDEGPWPSGIDVVAQSMGGAVLLRDLTADEPLLPVRRAVLVSAGGAPLSGEARRLLGDYDGTLESMDRQVALAVAGPAPEVDRDALVARRHALSLLPGAYELMASLALRPPGPPPAGPPADPTPYDRIRVPVLVLAGDADPLKPAGWAEEVTARIPGAQLRTFAGAGHCLQLDDPKGFTETVLDWTGAPRR